MQRQEELWLQEQESRNVTERDDSLYFRRLRVHDNDAAHGGHGQPLQHHAQLVLACAHIQPCAFCGGYLRRLRCWFTVHLT